MAGIISAHAEGDRTSACARGVGGGGRFDLSKIPDVYDCAKYDALHNMHVGLTHLEPVYRLCRSFADLVIPQVCRVCVCVCVRVCL